MENESSAHAYRRQRGNRSGGRSRNRQQKSSTQGSSSGGNRNRRRRRGGPRTPQPPKQTTAQKILSLLTFGLLGKPKQKPKASLKKAVPKSDPARSTRPESKVEKRPVASENKKSRRNRAEVTSSRLYVGNLDYSTGENELTDLFKGVGNVLAAEVVTNPRTQQSKGFAFVEMGSIDEAKRAVAVLDDQEFHGRRLVVSGARNETPSENPDQGESAMALTSSEERT
ncbi:MAG: hypothetical protein KDN18_04850 [Verrucomicrobiae bacterium]|nr:hypothetical protein [Verrucomicrobiae bacterium]